MESETGDERIMDSQQFRVAAKAAVDQIADYLESVPSRRVVSAVAPGYLRPLLPESAPQEPEPWEAIAADISAKIVPGITHWSSPRFMAFFPCTGSYPAAVAEMWSNAFNGAHFNWVCSPAVTELEVVVMDWTARLLSLPACFRTDGPTRGGGVILGSASEAILTVMVAARDRFLAAATAHLPAGSAERDEEQWRLRSRLVALGSAGAHSSTRKAAQILGVRHEVVPAAEADGFAMTGPALARALAALAARGLEPFYLTATLGSTDVCAVDDLDGIAAALAPRAATPRDVWVHVDAAYAGAALVLDEHRPLADAAGRFRSFNFNPHKWLFTTFDCSALFVRRRDDLIEALSVQPPYLRNAASDAGAVVDFRDWQIALGRRFRSLKLWAVLRAFGARALRDHVRLGIRLAEALEARLRARSDLFAVFTPARFALVTLRLRADADDRPGRRTQRLHRDLDARGDFFLTATVVDGRFAIRVCTAGAAVRDEHVQSLFEQLVERAEAVLAAPDDDDAAP